MIHYTRGSGPPGGRYDSANALPNIYIDYNATTNTVEFDLLTLFENELIDVKNSFSPTGPMTIFLDVKVHDEIKAQLWQDNSEYYDRHYCIDPPDCEENTTIYEQLDDPLFRDAYSELIAQLEFLAATHDVEFIYDIADEPCSNYRSYRIIVDRLYPIIKEQGGRTSYTEFYLHCRDPIIFDPEKPTEVVIPSFDNPEFINYKVYSLSHITEREARSDPDRFGYYTTGYSHYRSSIYNRFLLGYYAQRTQAKVIGIYSYGGDGDYSNNMYNDFDSTWDAIYPSATHDYLLAYPSWRNNGEMISTMAFESLKEGIIDAKYIATLDNLVKTKCPHPTIPNEVDPQCTNALALEANNYLTSRFASLPINFGLPGNQEVNCSSGYINDNIFNKHSFGFEDVILGCLSGGNENDYEVFDRIRSEIADYILQLKAQL